MKAKFFAVVSSLKAKAIPLMAGATTAAALAVPSFAAEGDPLPTISITQDMLSPLVQGIVSNVAVILPVGLGIFAIFLGIRIIPGMIRSFVRM